MNPERFDASANPPDDHPSIEQLAAYQRQELEVSEVDRVQEHFLRCPDCAALLLDLAAWPTEDLPSAGDPGSTIAREQLWQRLQREIGDEPPAVPPQRSRPRRRSVLQSWVLAAVLILGLGIGYLLPRPVGDAESRYPGPGLRQQQAAERPLVEPQLNVSKVDLFPSGYQRSTELPILERPLPNQVGLLQLHRLSSASTDELTLRIDDEGGREIWRGTGITAAPSGAFIVAVPGSFLPPGRYSLSLIRSVSETQEVILERYAVQVVAPETVR